MGFESASTIIQNISYYIYSNYQIEVIIIVSSSDPRPPDTPPPEGIFQSQPYPTTYFASVEEQEQVSDEVSEEVSDNVVIEEEVHEEEEVDQEETVEEVVEETAIEETTTAVAMTPEPEVYRIEVPTIDANEEFMKFANKAMDQVIVSNFCIIDILEMNNSRKTQTFYPSCNHDVNK